MKKAKQTTYWPPEMDEYIALYNTASCAAEKEQIFNEKLFLPLFELATANFNCHKSNESVLECQDTLIRDMVTLATTKLPLYQCGKKSFPYFNVVCRNYLWQTCNRAYDRSLKSTSLDALLEDEDGESSNTHVCLATSDMPQMDARHEEFQAVLKNYWNKYEQEHGKKIGRWTRLAMRLMLADLIHGDFMPLGTAPKKSVYVHLRSRWDAEKIEKPYHNRYGGGAIGIIAKVNEMIYQRWLADPDYFVGEYKPMVLPAGRVAKLQESGPLSIRKKRNQIQHQLRYLERIKKNV